MLDTTTLTALWPEPPRPEVTASAAKPGESYALGDGGRFVLRRRECLLLLNGVPVELGSRAVEILLALVDANGALLTKNALLDRVWPEVVVEENNLYVQVSALRRALGPEGRGWIATVTGRGYRFTGPVAALANGEAVAEKASVPATLLSKKREPPPLSVLVLPFAGRGDNPAGAWFADSVTDSLTTDLARMLPLGSTVVAQTTAGTYKGQHGADVRAIAYEQCVRYVVEGSVLLADDRVRVNAQLVAADTGAHVWAERFDTPRWDALQAQDEIVGRLSRAVGLRIVEAEAHRAEQQEHAGASAEEAAKQFVLRGLAQGSRTMATRDDAEAARILYATALELDPGNAGALAGAGLQRVYQVLNGHHAAGQGVDDETARREAYLAEAEDKLARALAIAPSHPEVLKARAVLLRARGLFADALAAAEALLARNPGDPIALRETGMNLLYLGRAEEAVTWLKRAGALAPFDPVRWTWLQGLGCALIQLGRDREAADALRLAATSNPGFAPTHGLLAAALALSGDDLAARAALAQFRRAEPDTSVEVLARRTAVPFEATAPLYQSRNERVLEGLRHAASLLPSSSSPPPVAPARAPALPGPSPVTSL